MEEEEEKVSSIGRERRKKNSQRISLTKSSILRRRKRKGLLVRRVYCFSSSFSPTMAEHLASLFGTEKDRVNVSRVEEKKRGRDLAYAKVAAAADGGVFSRPPLALPLFLSPFCPLSLFPLAQQKKHKQQCPFYFKIGACRHGDRCSRAHNKPSISPTVLLHNLWRSPAAEAAARAAAEAAETGLPPPPPKPPTPDEERRAQADFEDFYEDVFEELAQFGELEALHVCDNVADHLAGSVYAMFADEDDAAAAVEALRRRFYDGRPIVSEFSPVTDFREATCRQYEERCCARGG